MNYLYTKHSRTPDVIQSFVDGPVGAQLQAFASIPFDLWKESYANMVKAGLLPNSILASRDVSLYVDSLEKMVLGPLARTR